MLRGAPPAAGPTGTVGRARATPELHGAVRSGTVGRGPNRDHRPWTGRGGFASTHAHLGTAGRETILGIAGRTRAGGAARLGVDLHVYACPPWHRRPRDPQGDRGLRAGRRSCVTRSGHNGCRRDASDRLLLISCTGGHGNDHVAIILFTSRYWSLRKEDASVSEVTVERRSQSIKADGEETRQSSYNSNCV
jgi:hypothetical protein